MFRDGRDSYTRNNGNVRKKIRATEGYTVQISLSARHGWLHQILRQCKGEMDTVAIRRLNLNQQAQLSTYMTNRGLCDCGPTRCSTCLISTFGCYVF